MTLPDGVIAGWAELVLMDDTLQLQSSTCAYLSHSMIPMARTALMSTIGFTKDPCADTFQISTPIDPWTIRDSVKATLRSLVDEDVRISWQNSIQEAYSLSRVIKEAHDVTARMHHYTMLARAHDHDADTEGNRQLLLKTTLNDPNHTRRLLMMSRYPMSLTNLNAALLSPVRCNWECHAP
jgi:hypothetical protein